MRYAWDTAKDLLNRRKHGLSLKDGITALEDPERDCWIDSRLDYGEERMVTLGMGLKRVLYVVSTEQEEDCIRIISVRNAVKDEIERYGMGRS
jgi:uncharacterized DUF497 family protein